MSEELRDLLISPLRNRCACQDDDRCQACSACPYSALVPPAGWLELGTDPKTGGTSQQDCEPRSRALKDTGRRQTPRRDGFQRHPVASCGPRGFHFPISLQLWSENCSLPLLFFPGSTSSRSGAISFSLLGYGERSSNLLQMTCTLS